MNKLQIYASEFINWYYYSGDDQIQEEILLALAHRVVEGLLEGDVNIIAQEILDECNHDIIPLNLVQGLKNSHLEIGDVFNEYEIELIY